MNNFLEKFFIRLEIVILFFLSVMDISYMYYLIAMDKVEITDTIAGSLWLISSVITLPFIINYYFGLCLSLFLIISFLVLPIIGYILIKKRKYFWIHASLLSSAIIYICVYLEILKLNFWKI